MAEISLSDVSFSYGGPALLDGAHLNLEQGERVALIGRNGAGKSTLLEILLGRIEPDDGRVVRRPGLSVAGLEQSVPDGMHGTVAELVQSGFDDSDEHADWEADKRTTKLLAELDLDGNAPIDTCSAGTKRRALLARALALDPDVLVLDEPTNHLDIESVQALEDRLIHRRATLLFVTHDRRFLERVATRIVDLDRGSITSYDCGYHKYLERKAAALEAESHQNAEFDKKLAQEEKWIRGGILARRTRNQGRVRALKAMREERQARRNVQGKVKATLHSADRSGQLVLRAQGLTLSYDDKPIVKQLGLELQRGDRVGLLGPNGSGKTTLIRLLLGEIEPDAGLVELGTNLQIARFHQLGPKFDPEQSVQEFVCGDGDTVHVGGEPRHVMSYLGDFLFTPDQIRGRVGNLSGGERNRLSLAQLFARPSNLLVLDEPTNDLDLETLELLEELLLDYKGTLLLVSHDRAFLDNVVTSTLAFEGDGVVNEYVGGYSDWLRQHKAASDVDASPKPKKAPKPAEAPKPAAKKSGLTFTEQHELEKLPEEIEALEAERDAAFEDVSKPDFYKQPPDVIAQKQADLQELEARLQSIYARWEVLEIKSEA